MHFRNAAALFIVTLLAGAAAFAQTPRNLTPRSDDEKAFYALGVMISSNLQTFDLTEAEMAMVIAGVADGARNNPKIAFEDIASRVPRLKELESQREEAAAARELVAGDAYRARTATGSGASKLASGVVYTTIKEGTGASPKQTDVIQVRYTGTLIDGKEFDSSKKMDEPPIFPLGEVIPCWTEAIQRMKVGGKARFICPPDMAYGPRGQPPVIRGNATLIFEVELLEIMKD